MIVLRLKRPMNLLHFVFVVGHKTRRRGEVSQRLLGEFNNIVTATISRSVAVVRSTAMSSHCIERLL